jgi:hypothetical protein
MVVRDPEPQRDTPVLKLHGSVSWNKDGRFFSHSYVHSSIFGMLERHEIPLIATPGPNKLALQETDLKPIWTKAEEALREASTIVFMGYRFPPSDSESREVLLRAINNNKQDTLRIHTVLGPRTEGDDSVRLRKLLEHSMRQAMRRPLPRSERRYEGNPKFYSIESHPLYVEDFMTVMYDWMLA